MLEADSSECQESSSITFEWTLRGLKNLFDSTKGEQKSKVTKSAKFGGGRWQILFYPNAGTSKEGTPDGQFVSLYLSCEPTAEEKEASLASSGRWVREGVYKFSFELRNIGKSILYNLKEAHNHSFSYKTANWGWAQFARRDTVYYQSTGVKPQDAFIIICTITTSPKTPSPPQFPRQAVPKGLLDTVGALLDNPLYSDVQFILPRRDRPLRQARKLWAARLLLRRAEYFDEMFSSGFAEGMSEGITLTPRSAYTSLATPVDTESGSIMDAFEDSDDEDEEQGSFVPDEYFPDTSDDIGDPTTPVAQTNVEEGERQYLQPSPRLTHLELPNTRDSSESEDSEATLLHRASSVGSSKSPKMTVVVRDVAYTTFRAILYYIYTDNIVFAPLSSSFILSNGHTFEDPASSLPPTPSENQGQVPGPKRLSPQETATSRAEWIRDWMENNHGRPAPCSAKATYRVADRLGLGELKERAAQHIFKSLTVDNIAYEVFSPFAAAFDEIRKVEVNFFLTHWQDIRASESMRNVWQQIRNGRHPGFEEVWPLIAESLEFKPSSQINVATSKAPDATQQGSG